jgi:hypothetical protein
MPHHTLGTEQEPTTDPLQVLYDAIVDDDGRDWGENEHTAIILAILCGWHEVMPEIAKKFGWSEEQIGRLSFLRARFLKLCPIAADK